MKPMKKSYATLALLTAIAMLLTACGGAPPAPAVPSAEPGQTTPSAPAQQPTQAPVGQPQVTPETQPAQPAAVPGQDLGSKQWQWVNTTYSDGRIFTPSTPTAYTIEFSMVNGQVAIKADCNTAQGDFMTANQELGFMLGGMSPTTCTPDSLSAEFLKELSEVTAYQVQGETLTFTLSNGTMTLIAGQAAAQPSSAAGPAASLEGPTWKWLQTASNDGSTVAAPNPDQYTLKFDQAAKRFTFIADCNNGSGSYTLAGQTLTMKVEGMTRAACPAPSDEYIRQLDQIASYKIEGSTLSLILKADSGTMKFTTSETQPAAGVGSSSGTPAPATSSSSNLPRLTTGAWKWEQSADSNSGQVQTSPNPANYTIQFNPDGTATIHADCNSASAAYQADETSLTVTPGPATLIACPPPTLGSEFLTQLGEVLAYSFDGNNLILWLKTEGSSMKFSQ